LTLILVTISPLIHPISPPAANTMPIATGIGSRFATINPVTRIPCRLAAKPIERSSSPTTTARVRPAAMIMASDAWLSTLTKLLVVGNARGERTENAAIIATRPMIVP
jgi:hypothetical protein